MRRTTSKELPNPSVAFTVILHFRRKKYEIDLRIFDTYEHLNEYYVSKVDRKRNKGKVLCAAVFANDPDPVLCELVFSLEDLTYPLISHELNHAIMHCFSVSKTEANFQGKPKLEEEFCECQEDLFYTITNELIRRKVEIRQHPKHV